MKILLTVKFSEVEPLGLMYLCSVLKKHGSQVEICFYKENPFYEIYYKILSFKPDIVGFSVYTGNHLPVYDACKKIKKEFDIKTAIGGPHTTYFYDDCKLYADYVFRGEALQSFLDLDDQKTYPLLDIEHLPHPDREQLYKTSEFHKNNRIKNIMTSFGCPYNCHYCYNSSYKAMYKDYKVRLRPVDDVINETKNIQADLIYFQDDCFGFNLNWLEEFASKWKNRPYHCQMRFEMATDHRLKFLKFSGCTGVTCAIECTNRDIRYDLLNRNVSDEDIILGAEKIKSYGLKLRTEQMLGLPETTINDELELLRWNVKIKPDIAWVSIYQPYRGTLLGEYCLKKGYYSGNNDDISSTFFENTVLNFSPYRKEQIYTLNKIFPICAHLPEGHKLAEQVLKSGSILNKAKDHFYNILYS